MPLPVGGRVLFQQPSALLIELNFECEATSVFDHFRFLYARFIYERYFVDREKDRPGTVDWHFLTATCWVSTDFHVEADRAERLLFLALDRIASASEPEHQGQREIDIEPVPENHHSTPNNRIS